MLAAAPAASLVARSRLTTFAPNVGALVVAVPQRLAAGTLACDLFHVETVILWRLYLL